VKEEVREQRRHKGKENRKVRKPPHPEDFRN